MANVTIRNIDEAIKARLRVRSAMHSRSKEDEAHDVLGSALANELPPPRNLARRIIERFKTLGGGDLPEVKRDAAREPANFE